jgi:hypothetical protein
MDEKDEAMKKKAPLGGLFIVQKGRAGTRNPENI